MKTQSTFLISILSATLFFAIAQSCSAQWYPQPSHLSPNNFPQFIDAVDTNVVWAITQDQEFTKTTNGGFSWEAGLINNAVGFGGCSIYALNADTAWVAMFKLSGNLGKIFKTTDGGSNWVYQSTAQFSGTGAFADFVFFWNRDDGICVGDPVGGYFEIYTTNNGGTNWIRTPSANIPSPLSSFTPEYGLTDVFATNGDSTIWFGTSSGRVFKSIDRGLNWTVSKTPYYDTTYAASVGCIAFKDSVHGMAGAGGPWATNSVITSDNGGLTWTTFNGVTDSIYFKLAMAYVPGSAGTYFISSTTNPNDKGSGYTTDDGNNWTIIDTVGHTDLDFVNASTGWSGSNEFDSVSNSYLMYRWGSPAVLSGVSNTKPNNFSVSISPNPFSLSFELKNPTSEKATLKIFDVEGNLLQQQHLNAGEEISMGENFPSGIYLLQLQTGKQTSSVKVVKTK